MSINYSERIPNNVDLVRRPTLCSARSRRGSRSYLDWWREMGPEGFQDDDVYLRTATSVDAEGWATLRLREDARLPLGHLPRRRRCPTARIGFGDHMGEPVWQQVPGEHRNMLRRLIVTQGDTEPASVEQQRILGKTCPSALRSAQPLPGERRGGAASLGDGLPAPRVLRPRRPRGGRGRCFSAAAATPTSPRILGAFNEPSPDWLSFFMFTYFTDRDGKYQLASLAESGLRSALAHLPLHADRGGASHVRRRDGHRCASWSAPAS